MPYNAEDEMRHVVVDDRLVTGQNPWSASVATVAYRIYALALVQLVFPRFGEGMGDSYPEDSLPINVSLVKRKI
jgi:hypothetical protein